jgi:hypothetical protein
LSVPPGIQVLTRARGYFVDNGTSQLILLSSPDEAAVAGSAINTVGGNLSGASPIAQTGRGNQLVIFVRTNTSAQIRAVASGAGTSLNIATYGWLDPRGRNA